MESRPSVHDATSQGLSSAPTTAIQLPTYSSCFYSYNYDHSLVEHIPPGSGTSQRVFPDPVDCSGSLVASSVDQSSTIAPGSSTRSTCATHPLSSREVGPGCEDLEFRSSASESPPPSYETAMITLRPRSVKITSRINDMSGQGHNLSTMSSTSRLGPSMITSRDLTSCPDRAVPPVPSAPRADPSINRLPMAGIHRPIADRISRSTPCNTFVEQTGRIHSEDTVQSVHRCGRKIGQTYQFIGSCCFSIVFVVLFIFLCKLIKDSYFV